jgi:cell division protein FtsB
MWTGWRGVLERRGAAALVLGLFVAVGLIVIFAGTLTRATELEQLAAVQRASVAAMQEQLDAAQAEVQFLESDELVEQHARALGLGYRGERAFQLPADAPSPEPIVPLGSDTAEVRVAAPLDAWLDLLFGA